MEALTISSSPKIIDLSPLRGKRLYAVYLFDLNVSSLEPLGAQGETMMTLMVRKCPKLKDTDKIPEYFPNLDTVWIDTDFPHPEIFKRCAKLRTIKLNEPDGPRFSELTADNFRQWLAKKGKKPARR